MKRPLFIVGGMALTSGVAFALYGYLFGDIHTLKNIRADTPDKTGYKLVNALLPKLRAISSDTGIPLGLMIAWIAKESGGKLTSYTSLDERGYYQLMPAESKAIGVDHERLSKDSDYSLEAGTKLIKRYAGYVDDLNVVTAPRGSTFYWLLVKLVHTIGVGQTKKLIKLAREAGHLNSWQDFADYTQTLRVLGPQPKKWMPFLATIYALGRPFGFGSDVAVAPALVSGLSAICPYCEDGYHKMCDAKDHLGTCSCSCNGSSVHTALDGLDFLGV